MNIELCDLLNKKKKVTVVTDQTKAAFITHKGTFHADEVMSTCILINKFGDLTISRESDVENKNAFCYDLGFGDFDHHQAEFNELRSNGIKYASCGLLWRAYGKDIISKMGVHFTDELFKEIDRILITDIDRDDNGQALLNEPEIKIQSIPSLIASFNPSWNDETDENEAFLQAVSFANVIFNKIIKRSVAKYEAKEIIDKKIDESHDGILTLDTYMPWKDAVLSSTNPKASGILYAVFPSKRGGYNVVATPVKQGSFDVKKPFPNKWAGLDETELRNVSGVDTIRFCHKNLFLCACGSFEDAIKIASVSIKNK